MSVKLSSFVCLSLASFSSDVCDRSSVNCPPVNVAVLMLIFAAEMIKNLGNEQDLNDFLNDDGREPGGAPQVPEEPLVVVPRPQPANKVLPLRPEGTQHGQHNQAPQNGLQSLVVLDEAREEPGHADGRVEVPVRIKAARVAGDVRHVLVEQDQDGQRGTCNDEAEGAVPVEGLGVVHVSEPATDLVLGSLTPVTSVKLSVTHNVNVFF